LEHGTRPRSAALSAASQSPHHPILFCLCAGILSLDGRARFLVARSFVKNQNLETAKNLIEPFSLEQVESLVRAYRQSTWPLRNEAILVFMFDTGLRASSAIFG
jgi:hypothetical protein